MNGAEGKGKKVALLSTNLQRWGGPLRLPVAIFNLNARRLF